MRGDSRRRGGVDARTTRARGPRTRATRTMGGRVSGGGGKKSVEKCEGWRGRERGASARTRTPRECVWPSGSKAARSPGRLRCPRRLAFFCLPRLPCPLPTRPSLPPHLSSSHRRHPPPTTFLPLQPGSIAPHSSRQPALLRSPATQHDTHLKPAYRGTHPSSRARSPRPPRSPLVA